MEQSTDQAGAGRQVEGEVSVAPIGGTYLEITLPVAGMPKDFRPGLHAAHFVPVCGRDPAPAPTKGAGSNKIR